MKDLDKFDMIFQAYEYEQLENKPGSLQEFFDSTNGNHIANMSMVIRKPAIFKWENNGADQLRGNPAADQRLCFAT